MRLILDFLVLLAGFLALLWFIEPGPASLSLDGPGLDISRSTIPLAWSMPLAEGGRWPPARPLTIRLSAMPPWGQDSRLKGNSHERKD